MKVGRSAMVLMVSFVATLAFTSVSTMRANAQSEHSHGADVKQPELTNEQKAKLNALVKVVRDVTERFQDVRVAEYEGYTSQFGCVSGPDFGAMGLHYVNGPLVGDGEINPRHPEIVIYEPAGNGRVRLTGVEYVVIAEAWNETHDGPPQVLGQLMHLVDAPNRFGLPPFYELHVWAWKENPTGTFVNWHSNVSCDTYSSR
jgi:hypothetical protein